MTRIAVTIIALSMVQCERQHRDTPPAPSTTAAERKPAVGQPSKRAGKPKRSKGRAKAPEGFVEVNVKAVIPSTQGNAVMLVDGAAKRALLVFVGETEALSIHLRLAGEDYTRPLTHDLFDDVLEGLGARVHSSQVDRLDNDVFFGVVSIEQSGTLRDYDARSSDAIALALGSDAPIFVSEDIMKRASVELDEGGMPSASASAGVHAGQSPIPL
jgi:hypothetical protein